MIFSALNFGCGMSRKNYRLNLENFDKICKLPLENPKNRRLHSENLKIWRLPLENLKICRLPLENPKNWRLHSENLKNCWQHPENP